MAAEKPARPKPSITYDVVIHYPISPAEAKAKVERGEYPSECVIVASGLASYDLAKKLANEQSRRLQKERPYSSAYAAIVERGFTSPLQVNPTIPDRWNHERND